MKNNYTCELVMMFHTTGAISTHALHRGTLHNYTVLCILHTIIVYTNSIKISCPQHDALYLNTESSKETKRMH